MKMTGKLKFQCTCNEIQPCSHYKEHIEKVIILRIESLINKRIKMWESDIKGNLDEERYYGVSGCMLKELEELFKSIKEIKNDT